MRILCINLDGRPDRWEQVTNEFNRVGLTVERFSAITGDNRCLAFNKSVYECMKLAKGDDLLLFEDDVVFEEEWTPLGGRAPEDWLTIHLGANIIGSDTMQWKMPDRFNEDLALLHNCWQSHATLYSADCVQFILDNFPYHTDEYEREGLIIFDEWLRTNVLSQGRSYLINPMIAYQRPSKSDIWNCESDYTGAHRQGNEWLKRNL
jgi:hypothetical protein